MQSFLILDITLQWTFLCYILKIFFLNAHLHMLSLSSLPYKNMRLLQLLLDMIHHLDKINCHMVKLENKHQFYSLE